jgi:hypothetical protein
MSHFDKQDDPWASSFGSGAPAYSFGEQPAAPQPTYAAPESSFAPPPAPEPALADLQPTFAAPESSFAPPQANFAAPEPALAAAQPTFAAPESSFAPPHANFAAPQPQLPVQPQQSESMPQAGAQIPTPVNSNPQEMDWSFLTHGDHFKPMIT